MSEDSSKQYEIGKAYYVKYDGSNISYKKWSGKSGAMTAPRTTHGRMRGSSPNLLRGNNEKIEGHFLGTNRHSLFAGSTFVIGETESEGHINGILVVMYYANFHLATFE